ncbi:MAG: hypothetical protein ACR2P3_07110 [Geminicoccaceae bacterium]
MGIADFFLGKKGDSFSLNDLTTASRASTPNIFGPGFRTSVRNVRAPGTINGVPQTRQEISILEDPNIRIARESQQALAAQLSGQLGGFFGDPIQADQERAAEIEQATFDRALNLLQPGLDRNRRRVEQGLSNRGLPEGSEARGIALQDLSRDEQAQLENLALSAVLAGEQAQTADVNRQLSSRNQFLNQLAQLLAPQTGVQSLVPQPTLSGGDILAPNAQQGALLGQRNQQQGALLGALLGAGGTLGGAGILAA